MNQQPSASQRQSWWPRTAVALGVPVDVDKSIIIMMDEILEQLQEEVYTALKTTLPKDALKKKKHSE